MIVSGGSLVTSPSAAGLETLGGDTPQMRATTLYNGGTSVGLAGLQATYAAIYRAQLWVHVLAKKRALATARLPLQVTEQTGDQSFSAVPDSPYAQLLAKPNPKHDPFFLWVWTSTTLDVYGEAMWVKLRDGQGRVREVWPMHPTNVLIQRDESGAYSYIYTAGSRLAGIMPAFPEADVVHFKTYSPSDTVRGLSPLEPLRSTLFAEDASRRGSAAMWSNGARPSVLLTHPKRLQAEVHERIRDDFEHIHAGVDSWGKTAVLEEGVQATVVQLGPEQMQYVEGRKLNREEVCAVYDVPPPVVHILDQATFSNITEQMRSMYRDTMTPHLGGFEATLAHQLRPDFSADDALGARFNLDDVLRGSFETRIAAYAQAIGTGQLTPAEARAAERRPFLDGSDQLLVNAALIPLKVVEQIASPAGDLVEQTPQKVKALTSGDVRKVGGRLSRVADVHDVDVDALVAGLDAVAQATVRALVLAARTRGTDMPTLRKQITGSVDAPLELPALDDGTPKELTA